jgi:hypothetical protein
MLCVGVVPPLSIACTRTSPNPDASVAALSLKGTETVWPFGANTDGSVSDLTPFGEMLEAPM